MAIAVGITSYVLFVLTLYREHDKNAIGMKDQKLVRNLARVLKFPAQSIGGFATTRSKNITQSKVLHRKLQELQSSSKKH